MGLSSTPETHTDKRVRRLSRKHYENFWVSSFFLPSDKRKHLERIYYFLRQADDLADLNADPTEALKALDRWEEAFLSTLQGNPPNEEWALLKETINQTGLPPEPFLMLLSAFRQDLRVKRYRNWEELFDYTRRSANPVGRLVLMLFNHPQEDLFVLSDAICTALQLTNFWQDIKEDASKDRIYIPQEVLLRFHISEEEVLRALAPSQAGEMISYLVNFTRELYRTGEPLLSRVHSALRPQLRLYYWGGWEALGLVEKMGAEVFQKSPRLNPWQKGRLLLRSAIKMIR